MEDLGEQMGRKPACAVGSDLPSGTAPPADSPLQISGHTPQSICPVGRVFGASDSVNEAETGAREEHSGGTEL